MKRRIEVRAESVKITAVLDTSRQHLARSEVDHIRETLADRLQEAVANLPYLGTHLNRVRVR